MYCYFCKSSKEEVRGMVEFSGVKVCSDCSDDMHAHFSECETNRKMPKTENEVSLTPKKIYELLGEHVIGQSAARRAISIAAYNHMKRIENPVVDGIEIDKSNILLIGPTGSGKTLIASVLAKILDVPFVTANATELTEAGYVGQDVESMIKTLIARADGDISKVEKGVIFIDEIDKIRRAGESVSITKDVSGEGVQQALLKLIEGCEVAVSDGPRNNPQDKRTTVNTKNILFICCGSFAGIEERIHSRDKSSRGIGFNSDVVSESGENFDYSKINNDDLIHFGMIPELVGRLPVKSYLSELSRCDLLSVMTEPKNAITKQFKAMFKLSDVDLTFNNETLEAIVDEAIEHKVGARGLRSIVESKLENYMFEIDEHSNGSLTI